MVMYAYKQDYACSLCVTDDHLEDDLIINFNYKVQHFIVGLF